MHTTNGGKLPVDRQATRKYWPCTIQRTNATAALINQSLSTLKACLRSISIGSKHIPFREAALTRVLQKSLTSVTCATAVLACVSPASTHLELTMGTMRSSVKLLEDVEKPVVREQEMHVEGIKKGGPKTWDRTALLQWFK